jgi:carboxymethylenebutenolidase
VEDKLASKTSDIELKLASGRSVRAALARPAAAKAPGLLLIHEWWGLNDEMRDVAARMADAGFLALAVDLFEGEVANEPTRARALMTGLDATRATETMTGWAGWMRRDAACNGRVGALGFCMGGGWALNTALATPLEAAVIFYGNCNKTAAELAALKGPVQGHFGRLDQGIPVEMAEGFREALKTAGKPGEIHIYEANHAFARIGGPNFHRQSADLAWKRTLEFLKRNLS